MSKGKKVIFIAIFSVLLLLIGAGLLFSVSEEEREDGLTDQFAVFNDLLAYVTYEKGAAQLKIVNLEHGDMENVFTGSNDKRLYSPTFSADGLYLAFVLRDKDLENNEHSTIYMYDLVKQEVQILFELDSIVTEVVFSPIGDRLFYLAAGVFTNYSPITGKRPHELDVYSYHLAKKEHEQHTEIDKYSMSSLVIAKDGETVYFQMDDDTQAETAEDIFATKQRIFKMSLDRPGDLTIVSDEEWDADIFDFVLTPSEDEIIFQSISNFDSHDIYQYELYSMDLNTKEVTQLTRLGKYAGKPTISMDGSELYFIVDALFGKRGTKYHLYVMQLHNNNMMEIPLH